MSVIAQDLWRTIIEYLPRDMLISFSNASAIFDIEIYRAGIRVFLCDNRMYYFGRDDIIIKLNSGKKLLLKWSRSTYRIQNGSGVVSRKTINYRDKIYMIGIVHYDPINDLGVSIGKYRVYIAKGQTTKMTCHTANISDSIDINNRTINKYIDLESRIIMSYNGTDLIASKEIVFEDFTILFKVNKWQYHSKQID